MTVKDIFALRKQGRIEEAYEAIRPIYKEHKGRFTTLCMFWTASDVLKLRLEQKRVEEAEKIYEALKRMLPRIEEIEASDDQPHHKGQARGFMKFAEGRLIKESERFRKRYFAMRDKKKHQAAENEGINIPSDIPSEDSNSCNSSDSCSQIRPEAEVCDIHVPEVPLSKGQQMVLECVKAHPGLNVPGISDETGIPAKSVERHVKVLIERNLIEHRGSKKTGGYYAR